EVAPPDDPLRINDEERPCRFAVALGEDPVGSGDRPFRVEVGEKREVQVAILRKRQMAPDSVHGNSEEFDVEIPEFVNELRVESQLVAAEGAPFRGIDAKT